VTLTMAMSTLSVVTTVLVLHLHHTSWTQPLPRWIQTLAFHVLAPALCIRSPLLPRASKPAPVGQMTSPEPEVENDAATMSSCGRSVDCLRCATQLCARVDEIAIQLRKVDDRRHLYSAFSRPY